MFKAQIISCASLLLLYPSPFLVVIIAILSVRIFASFTPLYPFFPAIVSKVIHRIGVLVFLSATAILAVHLNLWMLKISLMWIHGHIYSIIPGYNRWIWAIQLCGLAIIVYPRSWVIFLSDPTKSQTRWKASRLHLDAIHERKATVKVTSEEPFTVPQSSYAMLPQPIPLRDLERRSRRAV
jgi:hypothetical protein